MPAHQITELGNGLKVVTENLPSVRSVALGMMVGVGSRNESVPEAGISHFLEHLLFKGTDRYSSLEIDEYFDGIGAEINAGTDKETTTVYARFLDKHLEKSFGVIGDMVLRSTFPDIDSERQVVIEEIAMYEDEPQDKVHDQLAMAVFGDSPLGRPIIGRAEVIADVPVPEIAAYRDRYYTADNIVVAAAGAVDHKRIVELAETGGFNARTPAPPVEPAPEFEGPRLCFFRKDTEQVHIALGAHGIARGDDRRWTARLLDTMLGGSTSSRLFQEVREKRGLAYAIYSFLGAYRDSGQLGIYVGTRPDRVGEALEVVAGELRKIADEGVDAKELARAKENAKGRAALSMESTLGRMNVLATSVLMEMPVLSLEEIEQKVDAVTSDDIAAFAGEFYKPERFCAGAVGPDEDAFRDALEVVNPQLAASRIDSAVA